MSTLATIDGKKLKAEVSRDSSGFIVSVNVVVDKNTAILIRSLRKSETPVSNGAKPTDIPAIGEKLAIISKQDVWDQSTIDQKYAESFAKKLLASIENPENMDDYADAIDKKDKKASHKKESHVHFDKKSLKGAGFRPHGSANVAPTARKSPGAKGA
jgi:hypothetical protein